MKIAFICTEKLPVPPIAGGAVQQYIEGILPFLSSKYDITVYSISYPGLFMNEYLNGVRFIRLPGKNQNEYISNIRNCIEQDFELIHVFNRPSWVNFLKNKLTNSKFSLSLHNEMFHPEKISREMGIKCINNVEFISTVSEFIAAGVKKLYPEAKDKIKVVYSAADFNKYHVPWTEEGKVNKILLKRKFNLENYKVVLNVGRLSIKKGTHIILKAMKKVMLENPKTALVIVGSKWYGQNKSDDYTKSLSILSKELPSPVIFTGFITPYEIPSYYTLGDIFICASQWNEPLARVHYEAMAAGLPIITTNRGGNAEVITGYENGIVVDNYNNPNDFSYYISYLINNPSTAIKMGMCGRRLVEKIYNWKRVASEIDSLVNSSS